MVMMYNDHDLVCDNNISLRCDLNNVIKIGEIQYPFLRFFGEPYFIFQSEDGAKVKVCLLSPQKKIEYIFFWKRKQKIEECHSLFVDSWNEVREKRDKQDRYLGG